MKFSCTPCIISSDLTQIRQNINQSTRKHCRSRHLSAHYSNSIQGTKQSLYYPIQARDANNAITNQAAIDPLNQKDIIIRNSILISIDSSQKQNFYGLPTAKEMWVKISTLFVAQADEIEQQLITRIFNYQHNPGLS